MFNYLQYGFKANTKCLSKQYKAAVIIVLQCNKYDDDELNNISAQKHIILLQNNLNSPLCIRSSLLI